MIVSTDTSPVTTTTTTGTTVYCVVCTTCTTIAQRRRQLPLQSALYTDKLCSRIAYDQLDGTHRVQTHATFLLLLVSQMCINIGVIVISVQNALIDPVILTFDRSIQTTSFLWYPSSFPIPSLNTLGSFVIQLCCWQTDTQTNRRRRTSYTHADRLCRLVTRLSWLTVSLVDFR